MGLKFFRQDCAHAPAWRLHGENPQLHRGACNRNDVRSCWLIGNKVSISTDILQSWDAIKFVKGH